MRVFTAADPVHPAKSSATLRKFYLFAHSIV